MKRALALLLAIGIGGTVVQAAPPAARTAAHPWTNRALSPDRRAALLLTAMTRAEKLALVHGSYPNMQKVRPAGVPKSAGYFAANERLGIPAIRETDASLGVAAAHNGSRPATALPSGLAQAATFDAALVEAGGATIGREARAAGFNVMLAGGVNLTREPRNGRNFEYLGEDPLLAGTLAGHAVRGIQSARIAATVKHFALNAQETGRTVLDARMDEAALRESDLLAFEKAIELGDPASVMCSYNHINGAYACENATIFGALKRDWGFRGWVMSDWGAVHSTAPAIAAGLDQESGEELDKQIFFGKPLEAALATGEVSPARLDDMVRRILHGLFATGVMDYAVSAGTPDLAGGAPVTQAAAEAGIVLLKNERGLLPLAGARRVAVIGSHADIGVLSGGGSSQVIPAGSLRLDPPVNSPDWGAGVYYHPSSPLAALRAAAPATRFAYDDGTDIAGAAREAKAADVAIVVAHQWTSEGMDAPLALDDGGDALIAAIAAANPHTIVVLETGGPVLMPWLAQVGAVVETWYPGSRGGEAIANVLIGRVNPSGRLPITFPASERQLPNPVLPGLTGRLGDKPDKALPGFRVHYPEGADVGYRWYARERLTPLFAFGYGLSYTSFRHDAVQVDAAALRVGFSVANTGTRAGTDVAQVYATPPGGTPRLVGWSRVMLRPGERRQASITIDPRFLARFATDRGEWRLAAGRYTFAVLDHAGGTGPSATATLDARSWSARMTVAAD